VEYAAGAGVHGMDHAAYLNTYVENILSYWEGTDRRPAYSEIPGIGIPVSRIFLGSSMPMMRGQNVDALLDAALATGINAFDCARGYGLAENALGRWIRDRNNRDRVVILSKCGNVNGKGEVHVDRGVILSELNRSLKALGVDTIDIYLLHRDDPNTPVSEFIDTLNECRKEGKIRIFGVSNWTHQRIEEANRYAQEHGLEGFSVSSPNYSLARQLKDPYGGSCVTISGPENEDARNWYSKTGMPVLAYSSLGHGFFNGRFQSGDYETAKKVLDLPAQKGFLYEENMKRLHNAEVLAKRDGCSVAEIAMRYVFSSPMNLFAIASTTRPSRLSGIISAAHAPFSPEDVAYLENER
jgi:aryl-alcohol dehydrogenase-like predicted oxidoreductase